MAKPHKFAWNGVDIETSLSAEQVANMAQRAAMESTGDLIKGKQRIASIRSSDRQIEFKITDYLISFNKLMVFSLDLHERSGTTSASTSIGWYRTTQQTVGGFIPVSPKRMVAHHTYMQFVHNLIAQVKAADPNATVKIREGTEAEAGATPSPVEQRTEMPPRMPGTIPPPPPPPPIVPGSGPGRAAEAEAFSFLIPPMPSSPPAGNAAPAPLRAEPTASGAYEASTSPTDLHPGLVTAVPGFAADSRRSSDPPLPDCRDGAAGAMELDEEDDELELTRRAASTGTSTWELEFPDGSTVRVETPRVVGRNPSTPDARPGAQPLRLEDHTQSVSKTHAAVEGRDGYLWITDLHSTNGTTLTGPTGEEIKCVPGQPVPADKGWRLSFGDFTVRVRGR